MKTQATLEVAVRYQPEVTESGDSLDSCDSLAEAEAQVEEYVREDKSNYSLREYEDDYAVFNADGDMEDPEYAGTQVECNEWIDQKCPSSYYSIYRIEEDKDGNELSRELC